MNYRDIDDGDSGGAGRNIIDDVTRPMPRREAEPGSSGKGRGSGGNLGRSLSGILQQKKGPTLLEDGGEEIYISGMAGEGEDASGRDRTRRDAPDDTIERG